MIYDYNKRREYLKSVFEDTMELIRTDKEFGEEMMESVKSQKFYGHNDPINVTPPVYYKQTKTFVTKSSTMDAARKYFDSNKHVAVLNFASATTPGGGVRSGSSAQEECLCRVSTLLPCLESEMPKQMFYNPHRTYKNPLHNDDIIYTPNVCVFKDDKYNDIEPFLTDVITCAAPNLRKVPTNNMNLDDGDGVEITNDELFKLHKSRARKILAAAASNKADVIVLGAFGCGVFQNPPEIVAKAFKEAAEEFYGHFDAIEFAVYCKEYNMNNYNTFKRIIENR